MLELTQWWKANEFDSRDWLVIGKGPTFSELPRFDTNSYHLATLNHVVRQVSTDVAHMIDIDVVSDCADVLLHNCRWLLMPRWPHSNCSPGARPLEDYFDEVPVLRELSEQGRLVWYNLSTGPSAPESPRIDVKRFSVEAVIHILAECGVRTIRSIGIDGGRGYSSAFSDLAGRTMLANGHDSFSCQFDRIDELAGRYTLDYSPLVEPLRIFVGTDESQRVATRVLEYSIRQHTSSPVLFEPMFHLRMPTPRDKQNRPRTGFSFYRFAIPKLCGYRGRALYLDADMQVFSDISELWDIPFGEQRVLCTNQPDTPEKWNHSGSFFQPGRQMSVMLLDCDRLNWNVDQIIQGLDEQAYTYQQLMFDLCLVEPHEIEDRIPPEWNCLEWFEPDQTRLLHYTVVPTQPWKNDKNPLASVWMESFRAAFAAGAIPAGEVLDGVQAGVLKKSLADVIPADIDRTAELKKYLRRHGSASALRGPSWKRIPRGVGRAVQRSWRQVRNSMRSRND